MSKQIITVSREFGSGGRTVGKRVAELLGVPYYDKELVKQVAVATGFDEKFVEQQGEDASPWKNLFSYAFAGMGSRHPMNGLSADDFLWVIQCKVILDLADKGPCVIVGRCADHILREQKPVRIFAYADMESRIKRCMERRPEGENLTEAQMRKRITEIDRNRAKYYAFFSEQKWGARENYDLLVNTSGADIKEMSSALCGYLETLFE